MLDILFMYIKKTFSYSKHTFQIFYFLDHLVNFLWTIIITRLLYRNCGTNEVPGDGLRIRSFSIRMAFG